MNCFTGVTAACEPWNRVTDVNWYSCQKFVTMLSIVWRSIFNYWSFQKNEQIPSTSKYKVCKTERLSSMWLAFLNDALNFVFITPFNCVRHHRLMYMFILSDLDGNDDERTVKLLIHLSCSKRSVRLAKAAKRKAYCPSLTDCQNSFVIFAQVICFVEQY